MTSSLKQICAQVLKRVTPSESEQKKVQKLAKELTEEVEKAAKEQGVEIEVRVEGSVAKNTWLSDYPEIDVFMQVPTTISKDAFGTVFLDIAKKATEGYTPIERFAEHPYLEVVVEGVYVNVVPCYKVKQGKWISATDRTPFHTNYIKPLLNEQMSQEVRLLKRFMRGVGVYGAEIKVGGFSGYLCELLVLNYGSFSEVLRSAIDWKDRTIIDFQKHYKREVDAEKLFDEPLVMVDPVDKRRNVAAAVRKDRYVEFIAASREFMKTPNMNFFYPQETEALESTEVVNKIKSRGSTLVFISFNGAVTVPDVLWGQLYKNKRALRKLIVQHDFTVLGDVVWSNEKGLNIFIFEVENRFLPNMKRHLGPSLKMKQECENFLQKHLGADSTVSGPRLEDGRWLVDVKRKHTDVVELLKEKRGNGVAEIVTEAAAGSLEVMVNDEILKQYSSNPEFAKFFTEYLDGKPRWLVGV
ncbi:MAG: CCA tRNA nucleotidyltransferase [Candidatus Bathyarchaeota archaeon]|nr:CCA tRNA nucleotidyltransferase [Candidatus Bathyarchaeum sp.]